MSEAKKSKAGGGLFKILIVVLLVAILVGGAAFGGFYFASKQKTPAAATTVNVSTQVVEVDESFFEAGEFLVNLADTDSKRFLKVKIVLAYNKKTKKLATELTDKTNVVSDCIISVVRAKKAEEINGKGADDLKKEIIERINDKLTNGKLTNVYYSEFLIQ